MIKIKSFNPMVVEIPTGELVGELKVQLPSVHCKIIDLSMGLDMMNDAHIGTDFNPELVMTLSHPVSASDLLKIVEESEEYWEKIWEVYVDKMGDLTK